MIPTPYALSSHRPPARIFVVSILAVVLRLPAAAAESDAATEASIKAMITSGDITRAIEASRLRVAADPKDADAHVLLANALLRKATLTAQALPRRPDGSPAPIAAGDADAIVKELELAIRIVPERKDLYFGLIELAQTAGHEDEMIRQIERAAKTFPVDPLMTQGLLDYASEAMERRENALATRIIETVHTSYPHEPEATLAWASVLLNRGELEHAVQALQAGADAAPRSSSIFQSLGDASCYQINFAAAAKYYARALSLDPTSDASRLSWAAALQVSDPQGARTIVEPLWGGETKSLKAPMAEMVLDPQAKGKNRTDAAGKMLYRAIARPGLGAFDAYSLARSLWQAGFPAPALAETEVALAKDPALVEAQVLRAEIYSRLGMPREALEAAQRAESIFDAAGERTFALTRDEVIATRAAIEAKLGKNEDALASYARTSDPTRYSYQMALVAERLGRIDQARALLEKTIASGTNPAEIDSARARLAGDTYRKKP